MNKPKFLEDLMRAVATNKVAERVMAIDGTSWALSFHGDRHVLIQYSQAPERLIFSVNVGRVHEQRGIDAYKLALTYNFLSVKTGGTKVALNEPDGSAVLMVERDVEKLTALDVIDECQRLVGRAQGLRNHLVDPPSHLGRKAVPMGIYSK